MSEAIAWNNDMAPDVVWCCAGMSRPGLFIETPIEVFQDQMDSNYFSSVYIAHAALRAWLSAPANQTYDMPTTKEARHIIFTSSVAAFIPIAGYSQYTPSKNALRSLSDTLSQELKLYSSFTPVRPHTIFPATIFTTGLEAENKTKHAITKKLEESDGGQTADQVAQASITGLERGEELITTSGILGYLLKAGNLGCSKRNGWIVMDTITSWLVSIVLVFVRWDMDRTVKQWGKANANNVGTKNGN